MDHQAKISERNGAPPTTSNALAHDVGEFAHNVLTLAELQGQLLVADVQECGRRVFVPGLVLITGLALGLTCLPIALAAMALLIAQVFQTSYAAGFLITAAVGAAVSALLSAIGWVQVRKRVAVLGRSQQELVRNLQWIKKVLERSRITRTNNTDNSWRTVR
jgi:uncharacterized membrane protein YqjE